MTIWGQFTPLSVKDIIAGQAQDSQITARAKIRYRTDIDNTMRVEHIGRMYEIVGEPLADNASGREYLTLVLKNIVPFLRPAFDHNKDEAVRRFKKKLGERIDKLKG